jgi:hypothetical protein
MPRPKGLPKTGGRQKGGVDKIKREAILAAQGITPLDAARKQDDSGKMWNCL